MKMQNAARARLLEVAQHFETSAGTCGRLIYAGDEVVGRIGGYKESFPELVDLPHPPSVIARAIRRGKGKIYDRIFNACLQALGEELYSRRSRIAHKAWNTRRQLLTWGATSSPREAALKAWDTRRKRTTWPKEN